MKKLSLFAVSVSTALVCAAVPASFNWSPAKLTLFSLDTAEAAVGRPLTATSVAGVSRRVQRRQVRRAAVGVGVGAVGVGAVGAAAYAASGGPRSLGVVARPGRNATVIDPATGRRCTIEPSGWHWCWRP
jgi:hypothetical protein